MLYLVDVSDIFFPAQEVGRGCLRRREGWGIGFLLKIPGGGGTSPGREGPRGREGVCGELGNFGEGGGLIFFFSGAEMSTNFSNRVLVETTFELSKTLYLKAYWSLKNCLD